MNLERDYFMVEEVAGQKYLHYMGYTYTDDDDVYGVSLEYCGAFFKLDRPFGNDDYEKLLEETTNYRYDFETEEEMERYVSNYYGIAVIGFGPITPHEGEHLSILAVDENTPCGDYWC